LLTGVIISPRGGTADELAGLLNEQRLVRIIRIFDFYPTPVELARFVQTVGPAIVFLSTDDPHSAAELAGAVDRCGTGTQVVALDRSSASGVLIEIMRAGIREILSFPLSAHELTQAVARVTEVLARKPLSFSSTDEVYSFLPAKAGGGTSTLALNMASAFARCGSRRTLLADFDLSCGMISFLLKISSGRSVVDAIESSANLDETIWNNVVVRRDDVDVLPSGRINPDIAFDPAQVVDVLNVARRSYDTICLDLSGNMEPYSIELLRQSKEIFLVCTADIPSIHLARTKTQFLRAAGLDGRVSVLLNRSDRQSAFSTKEVEEMLGVPVRFSFVNDPRRVGNALRVGSCVDRKSELGRQFDTLASIVANPSAKPAELQANQKRRFVEYFAIVPAKFYADTERNS
jgi:pilus assembly protein CpaE